MSKILKARKLEAYPLYIPEITPEEEETFKVLFPSRRDEEIEAGAPDSSEGANVEGTGSEQDDRAFEREIEEIKRLAREEGYKAGFEEGYRAGLERGYEEGQLRARRELENRLTEERENLKREYEELRNRELERLRELLTKIEEEFRELTLNLDQEIVTIVKALLQKLILREMREDEALLYRIVREALNYIVEGTEIAIHVNPEELKVLEGSISTLPQANRIRLIPDDTITRGGVFIETKLGSIDATFEKRIDKIFSLLEEDRKASNEIQGIQG